VPVAAKIGVLGGTAALFIGLRAINRRSSQAMGRAMPRKATALRVEGVVADAILGLVFLAITLAVLFGT
jgi:hypothetical protein